MHSAAQQSKSNDAGADIVSGLVSILGESQFINLELGLFGEAANALGRKLTCSVPPLRVRSRAPAPRRDVGIIWRNTDSPSCLTSGGPFTDKTVAMTRRVTPPRHAGKDQARPQQKSVQKSFGQNRAGIDVREAQCFEELKRELDFAPAQVGPFTAAAREVGKTVRRKGSRQNRSRRSSQAPPESNFLRARRPGRCAHYQ